MKEYKVVMVSTKSWDDHDIEKYLDSQSENGWELINATTILNFDNYPVHTLFLSRELGHEITI